MRTSANLYKQTPLHMRPSTCLSNTHRLSNTQQYHVLHVGGNLGNQVRPQMPQCGPSCSLTLGEVRQDPWDGSPQLQVQHPAIVGVCNQEASIFADRNALG